MFLKKVEAAVSVMHVEEAIKKFLDKFFKEYSLPMPRIKIVNNVGSKWLGRCEYKPSVDPNNTTIQIQKRVTEDEKSLDRIIAHEIIHHWEFITRFTDPKTGAQERAKLKLGLSRGGHGKDFYAWADKINSVYGKDYVTERSDESYVTTLEKDYFLLIVPADRFGYKGKLGWAWCTRPTEEMKQAIERRIIENGAKLFKSKDDYFTKGAKIKKYGGISISSDASSQEKLQEIFKNGKEIKLEKES